MFELFHGWNAWVRLYRTNEWPLRRTVVFEAIVCGSVYRLDRRWPVCGPTRHQFHCHSSHGLVEKFPLPTHPLNSFTKCRGAGYDPCMDRRDVDAIVIPHLKPLNCIWICYWCSFFLVFFKIVLIIVSSIFVLFLCCCYSIFDFEDTIYSIISVSDFPFVKQKDKEKKSKNHLEWMLEKGETFCEQRCKVKSQIWSKTQLYIEDTGTWHVAIFDYSAYIIFELIDGV